jgi:hypothetical protein
MPMQNTYTYNEIILYIYNELDPDTSYKFQLELQHNQELLKEYNTTVKMLGMLDKLVENPNPTTIDLILEYSSTKTSAKTIG